MKEKVKATQLCPTLCDPMDYTVCEILHAGILEWVAFPSPGDFPIQFSNPGLLHWRLILYHLSQNNIAVSSLSLSSGSSWPRNQTRVFCTASRFFTNWVEGSILYILGLQWWDCASKFKVSSYGTGALKYGLNSGRMYAMELKISEWQDMCCRVKIRYL